MHMHFFKTLHFVKCGGGAQEVCLKWGVSEGLDPKNGGGSCSAGMELRPKFAQFRVPPLSLILAPFLSQI